MPLYTHGPYDDSQRRRALDPDVQHSRLIYLDLVEELEVFCRYVPPVTSHLNVYSTKLWGLLLRACSEVDSQLHGLIAEMEGTERDTNITDYLSKEPMFQLSQFKLANRFDGSPIIPFSSFANNKSPDWWRDYNAVKHSRLSTIENATLGNAIQAVGGLYIVLYRQWGEYLLPRMLSIVNGQHVAQPPSQFFSVSASPWG